MLNAAGTQACGGYEAGLGVWRAGSGADPVTGTGPLLPRRGPGASAPEEEAPEGGACPTKPGHWAHPWYFRRCGYARGLSPRPQSSAARPGQPDVAATRSSAETLPLSSRPAQAAPGSPCGGRRRARGCPHGPAPDVQRSLPAKQVRHTGDWRRSLTDMQHRTRGRRRPGRCPPPQSTRGAGRGSRENVLEAGPVAVREGAHARAVGFAPPAVLLGLSVRWAGVLSVE